MANPSPTPIRQAVRSYPTPLIGDVLFWEHVNADRSEHPAYGTAHPDKVKWPDHKLVLVQPEPDAERANFFRFFYAADRENQDLYNFAFTDADIGGTKFKAVERTYVIPRDDFDPSTPLQGASMPNVPAALFGTGSGTPSVVATYVLAERKQIKSPEPELDSLYVFEVRTYVTKAPISDIVTDKTLGIAVKRTTTLYYRGEIVTGSSTVEDLFDDPTDEFWGAQSDGTERDGQQLTDNWFAVIVTSSRDDALTDYKLSLPTVTNLNLPDVLVSAAVVWNKATSTGDFNSDWEGLSAWSPADEVAASLSGAESASAEASASLQPELVLNIRQPLGRNIPSTSWFFYMKLTSADTISSAEFLTKLGTLVGATVNFWPSFNPVAHSVALLGQKVAVSAKASASGSISSRGDAGTGEGSISWDKNYGTGGSYDASTMNGVVRIPPTIHGLINITGTLTDTAVATAACDVGWVTYSTGQSIAGNLVAMPAVTAASGNKTATATGLVSPTSLAATTPTAIPSSGYYVTESSIKPYEAGWVQCFAEVINAANI